PDDLPLCAQQLFGYLPGMARLCPAYDELEPRARPDGHTTRTKTANERGVHPAPPMGEPDLLPGRARHDERSSRDVGNLAVLLALPMQDEFIPAFDDDGVRCLPHEIGSRCFQNIDGF